MLVIILFVGQALTEGKRYCNKDDGGMEDVEMGRCLFGLNVTAGDTRDASLQPRFFALNPEFIIPPWSKWGYWYWKNQFYSAEAGVEKCCSNNTISFHYMRPAQMYLLEFFIYRFRLSKDSNNNLN
jgi:glycoprotein-N-acetylgalactosamine 3-beta-galactosyltransferase